MTREKRLRTVRSASVRNLALSGKSWIIQKLAAPATTVASPSRMKIHAHAGLPATPSMFAMAAASRPPKAPETVAAEKKSAARRPNSERLYQLKGEKE
jgi:hypothetical protein